MHAKFDSEYGWRYLASVWFAYRPQFYTKYCEMDGLLFLPETGRIILCEAKLAHTARAFEQCEYHYRPVLESLFPKWDICSLEVVRFFNSMCKFPVDFRLVEKPEDARTNRFNVLIF